MKMAHVTIHTDKLAESAAFYKEVVGLNVIREAVNGAGAKMIFLAEKEGDTCVELVENSESPFKGSGISIGFHVEDVEKMREHVVACGFEPSPYIEPKPGVKFFLVEEPSGMTVQFL